MKTHLLAIFSAFVALAMNISSAELSDAEWAELKRTARERQRHVIYDNDDDDLLCFPKDRPLTVENYLALRTSFLHNYPVDTMVVNANYGAFQQLVFPNDCGELADFIWDSSSKSMNAIPPFLSMGIDAYAEQIKYARAHDIEFFAGVRINDTHDVADTPEKPVAFFSSWKRCHLNLLMGSRETPPLYATWSSYDFTHPEVRDKFVAVCVETAQRYPIDGISIDLYRWLGTFKSVANGGEASDEEVRLFGDIFRRIRTATEAIGRKRGRPILLAVRVPDSQGWSRGIGFDWEGLMSDGVIDLVFAGGNTHLAPWSESVALCHKYGVKCYASIDMPSFAAPVTLSRHEAASYHAACAAAYAGGADGLYFFNLFNEDSVRRFMLGGAESYRLKDKHYHVSDRILGLPSGNLATGNRYNRMPQLSPEHQQRIASGNSRDFVLEFGDDIQALRAEKRQVKVTATMLARLDGCSKVTIASNGKEWQPDEARNNAAKDTETFFFTVPDGALLPGANTVTFSAIGAAGADGPRPLTILKGDTLLRGPNQPPWRRTFLGNADNSQGEVIVDGAYRIKDTGKGILNIIYPLASLQNPSQIDLHFEAKTDEGTAPLGAMLRVAIGGRLEFVELLPTEVRLHFAGKSIPLDTTEFHAYRVTANGQEIALEIDGKAALQAQVTATTEDPANQLPGASIYIDGMVENSLIFGSMANEEAGTSYWRNVSIMREGGDALLKDLEVQVEIR